MWRFFKRREKRVTRDSGLAEARKARRAAEQRLAVTHREVTVPLREMHRENHIQPRINALLRQYAERRRNAD